MLRLSMQSDETNRYWVTEFGSLGRTVAELRTGFGSLATDDSGSIITESNESKSTAINRTGSTVSAREPTGLTIPGIPPAHIDTEQPEVEERGYFPPTLSTLRVKDAIRCIPMSQRRR